MKLNLSEYRAILRNDLATFIERSFRELNPQVDFYPNWHIDEIAEALEDCARGKIKRLIINVPPRSLKSHCASVAFIAWLLGHRPNAQIICASYAQPLADKHAYDTRNLMNSELYRAIFATRLSPTKFAVNDFTTTEGGFRLATSIGGVLTGRGADFIIIDDPLKPDEALSETQRKTVNDWYDHTLFSRLNDKRTGCIIVIMQRLHEDDLVGHLLKNGDWKMLSFPAIAEEDERHVLRTLGGGSKTVIRRAGEALHPDREPLETLAELRQTVGEYNFAAQYQQAPAPLGGGLVKLEWFKRCARKDRPEKFELIFDSWDTANKPSELSDYSVCTTWGLFQKRLYLIDLVRKRLEYPELKRLVRFHADQFDAETVLIEDKASGTQLIQELNRDGFYNVVGYSSPMDKVMRLHSVTSMIESGFVYLPEEEHWLADYLHELAVFNKGRYDDQVDSTSQALDWFRGRSRKCYGLLEYAKSISSAATPDPHYAAMFMRPRGAAR